MAQAGLSQLFLYCLNSIAWILTLFCAVILNVAGLERTVKETSLGFRKKTNLNKKINFTMKQKSFQVSFSAPFSTTFLSQYLMPQNYLSDRKFLIENGFVENLHEGGCFLPHIIEEIPVPVCSSFLQCPISVCLAAHTRKWLRLGFFCCSGQNSVFPMWALLVFSAVWSFSSLLSSKTVVLPLKNTLVPPLASVLVFATSIIKD